MQSEQVFPQWRHPVASSEALDFLHWAMHAVLYRRIAMAIEMASKVGVLIHCCVVDCCPGGRRSDTEQVVAQWRRPVAPGVALDMLHQAMLHVLLQCLRMAIKWPATEVHSFVAVAFFAWRNRILGACYGPLKLIASHIIVVHYVSK